MQAVILSSSTRLILFAIGVLFVLTGCESMGSLGKKIDYKSVSSAPALEVPPDLVTPQSSAFPEDEVGCRPCRRVIRPSPRSPGREPSSGFPLRPIHCATPMLKQQTPMRGILAALWEGVNVSAEDIDEAFSARGYLMNIAVVKGDKR